MYHSTSPLQSQTIQALFNPRHPVSQTSQRDRKFCLHPEFHSTVYSYEKLIYLLLGWLVSGGRKGLKLSYEFVITTFICLLGDTKYVMSPIFTYFSISYTQIPTNIFSFTAVIVVSTSCV